MLNNTGENRRRFLTYFSTAGLGSSLLPGALWAEMQQDGAAPRVTDEMLKSALAVAGLEFSDADRKAVLQGVNRSLTGFEEVRKLEIPNDVAPPFYFSPIVPGMKVNRAKEPLKFSAPVVKRPANLEDVAFWPIIQLAQLIKTKQVTSLELTQMYLGRLHKYNGKLNCVVTFLDDVAIAQAKSADAEIAAGTYRGPLHGIPWGAKDIIAVKGFKTTWGSGAYKDQMIDHDASVIEMLRDAGAVLLAKLTSGELAQGDNWFGGQTKNPWNIEQGSSGSSAGPGSATAGGCVAFAIGTETSGSILSPSGRCGVTGLRPTFGRISRHGVMALSWTQDRLGPMCRYAEDCAVVMSVIAKPDGKDLSVSEIPFNWNAKLDIKKLRVGYLKDGFDEVRDAAAVVMNAKAIEQVRALGFKLVPVTMPDWNIDGSAYGVESAVFFDEMIRTNRDKQMTNPGRATGFRSARFVPAVEYLQSQRARTMMMMKLAEATADVDVYLVPANGGGGGGGRGRGAATDGEGRGRGGDPNARRGVTQRHFAMANTACYPAINVVHGFTEAGTPGSFTFYARPFGEAELLAVAKAYQDATGFHLKHPTLSV
ncbi:MAG TPA: amidase [Bryobacteraceae bacterium]|jgi:Asp-tRNA(Asn)/Glu-tRNA(Gln) amidotransferase A subunit family amidase|nr:amidase [Bryobacteraceae bacterium]